MDIRPYIFQLNIEEDCIFMQLSTGSVTNIKPELVMEAYYHYIGKEPDERAVCVHRLELYADGGTKDRRSLIPLEDFGEEIG